jgi:hypothetical protein
MAKKKKDKGKNSNLQNSTHRTKNMNPTKTEGERMFGHSCVQHILRFVFVFSSVYQTKYVITQYRLQHIYTVNLAVVAKRVNRS